MSFLSPIFFWSFLLLLPLGAVYFFKVRPRKQPTTALFLWQTIYKKKHTESLFNKLRDLLSLLMMILIFLMLTFAMVGPRLQDGQDKDLLIIIDNSASMAAGDGTTDRLARARNQAQDIVMALGAGHRAAIATASTTLEYKTFMSDNQRMLARAVDEVKQTELPFDSHNLEKMILKGVESQQVRVILITDAASLDRSFGKSDKNESAIEILKIGEPVDNLGFVACDLQIQQNNPQQMSFYFQLAATTDLPVKAEVSLYYLGDSFPDDITISDRSYLADDFFEKITSDKVIPVTVLPGVNKPEIFTIPSTATGKWLAMLDYDDALAVDNIVCLTVNSPEPVRVMVSAQEQYFFEHCVEAFSQSSQQVALVRGSEGNSDKLVYLCQNMQDYNHLLASNTDVDIRAIVFSPAITDGLFTGDGTEIAPGSFAVRTLYKDDPALSFYDVATIGFYGATDIAPIPGAQKLIETDTGVGLVWRITDGGSDSFFINMDPSEGEFYYSPYFPVMVFRMALSLAGSERIEAAVIASDDLLNKAGSIKTARADHKSNWQFAANLTTDSSLTGFYTYKDQSETGFIGCSMLNSGETLLNPEYTPDNLAPISKGHSISYWLIVIAIVLLVTESILYHRRKLG